MASVSSVVGNVGSDPQIGDTKVGPVTKFSLATTTSYGERGVKDSGETEWIDVTVFHEGLQRTVQAEIYKGAKVAVEGIKKDWTGRDGKNHPSISASRVGLVQWLTREQVPQADVVAEATLAKPLFPEDDLPF